MHIIYFFFPEYFHTAWILKAHLHGLVHKTAHCLQLGSLQNARLLWCFLPDEFRWRATVCKTAGANPAGVSLLANEASLVF